VIAFPLGGGLPEVESAVKFICKIKLSILLAFNEPEG
jgi:hypothetical protein